MKDAIISAVCLCIAMSETSTTQITQLLLDCGKGDKAALDQLLPLVYAELHRLANHYMRRERPDHTLQTSALINEAYIRLIDANVSWESRTHFFGIAARLMRQILVDHARTRKQAKRGGGQHKTSLSEALEIDNPEAADIIALDEALNSLAKIDMQQSRIVELRFFGGMTIEETAKMLTISHATVERDWQMARAWLRREMTK
jgi:RNA polymerase sigma-70 factor, ECF subfamily